MKTHFAAALGLLLCQSWMSFGQVAVLKASGDDPKTPLIVLSNPIAKPMIGESIKSQQDVESTLTPDLRTTNPPTAAATATTEKAIKKKAGPPKQKPFLNHGQKVTLKLQDLLSMPGIWESSPLIPKAPAAQVAPVQPMFYPMPVYIPYPIPFMLNQPMQLMRSPPNVEEKTAMSFNEIMTENLLRSSMKPEEGAEWHKVIRNRVKPADQHVIQTWRGKWRRKTTTNTPEPIVTTQPTRILLPSSDNEAKSTETNASNETTEASNVSKNFMN